MIIDQAPVRINEEQFQKRISGVGLTREEYESLRKDYGLIHDIRLLDQVGDHMQHHHLMMAHQKIRRNPVAMGTLPQ